MIVLTRLVWDNAFSYGPNNSLDILSNKITQIVGPNGHGKSSIPLILEEVFFNKNSKGTKRAKVVNRYSKKKSCSFLVEFSVDSDDYSLESTRSTTQKITLIKNGEDISGHTATATLAKVEEILGMDFKIFSQLVYQNSRSSLSFLTDTDTNRKKFLIDMMNLEKYVKYFEAIKLAYKDIESRMIQAKTSVSTIESWLARHENQDLSIRAGVEVPEIPQMPEIEELTSTLNNIVAINNKISQNNKYIELRDNIDLNIIAKPIDAKRSYDDIMRRKGELDSSVKNCNNISTKLQSLKEAVCPTCLQEVDVARKQSIIDSCKEEVSGYKAEILELEAKIKEIQKANQDIDKHQALVAEFEKYSNLIDPKIDKVTRDRSEISAKLTFLKSQLAKIKEEADAANKHNSEVAAHNAKVSTIKSQIEEFQANLAEATNKLDSITEHLNKLEVLKKTFSTNGLLAYKIENSVKDLEDITNEYLTSMSDGRFQLLFKLNNDKLNVVIVDNGEEIEITDLSSGELARVNTSALLALRKLMSSISNSNINILFLDETIDCLDVEGKEKLVEILLKETNLNTFIISHGYTHPLLTRLNVIKENKISRIED